MLKISSSIYSALSLFCAGVEQKHCAAVWIPCSQSTRMREGIKRKERKKKRKKGKKGRLLYLLGKKKREKL
jgi:hypothetical protein